MCDRQRDSLDAVSYCLFHAVRHGDWRKWGTHWTHCWLCLLRGVWERDTGRRLPECYLRANRDGMTDRPLIGASLRTLESVLDGNQGHGQPTLMSRSWPARPGECPNQLISCAQRVHPQEIRTKNNKTPAWCRRPHQKRALGADVSKCKKANTTRTWDVSFFEHPWGCLFRRVHGGTLAQVDVDIPKLYESLREADVSRFGVELPVWLVWLVWFGLVWLVVNVALK